MPIDAGMKLIVALLYAPGQSGKINEKIRGITRLDKLLFIIQNEGIKKNFYRFEAYDYGPWSGNIHGDIDALEGGGLVTTETDEIKIFAEIADLKETVREVIINEEKATITQVKIYFLSNAGLRAGKKIFEEQLTDDEREKIIKIKKKFNSIALVDLLRYVYKEYPEMAKDSKIKTRLEKIDLFGKRPELSSYEEEEG